MSMMTVEEKIQISSRPTFQNIDLAVANALYKRHFVES
jgi:hypothetical protein